MSKLNRLIPSATRTLLGLIFFVFGLNGFLHFLPQPPLPGDAGTFLGGLAGSGYFFPLLKGTEVLAGALLLSNRFVPLALTLLAPVVVNIAAFHLRFTPNQVGLSAVVTALEVFTAWTYRAAFKSVLATRTEPELGARAPRARAAAPSPAE